MLSLIIVLTLLQSDVRFTNNYIRQMDHDWAEVRKEYTEYLAHTQDRPSRDYGAERTSRIKRSHASGTPNNFIYLF